MTTLIDIPDQNTDREAWLAWRHTVVGGSDAGTILGLNTFKSRLELFYEKLNRKAAPMDQEERDRLDYYLDLEDIAARRYARKTGRKLQRQKPRYLDGSSVIACTVDRRVVGENARPVVVEIKTASPFVYKEIEQQGGRYKSMKAYLAQTTHNCAVWKADKGVLLVMNRDTGQAIPFEFDFNRDLWNKILAAEMDFVRSLETGTPPEMEIPADFREVETMAEGSVGVIEDPAVLRAVTHALDQYKHADEVAKTASAVKARARDELERVVREHAIEKTDIYDRRIAFEMKQGAPTFDKGAYFAAAGIDPEPFMVYPEPKRSLAVRRIKPKEATS